MSETRRALLEAVQSLVEANDASETVRVIEDSAECVRRHPLRLAGEFSPFNPLQRLLINDEAAYRSVARLIDSKRAAAGLDPAWPPPEPERFDKTEYQRKLMAQRRERSGRAAEIENMQRPEGEKLIGESRLKYERVTLQRWGEQLRTLLERARLEAGGRLPKEQQDELRERFWAGVDQALEEREYAVRQELLKPQHQRRPV